MIVAEPAGCREPQSAPGFMSTIFLLAFALYVLRPQDFIPAVAGAPLVEPTLLVGLLFWLGSTRKRFLYLPLMFAGCFVFVAALSVGVNGSWGGMFAAVATLAPAILLFMLAAVTTRDLADFRRFVWLLVVCCAVLVFHGYQQVTTGVGFTGMNMSGGTRIRYIGVFDDPNDLGVLFVLGYAGAGYLYMTSQSWVIRLLMLASLLWIAYGIVLTQSRGTLLASLVVTACVAIRRFGIGRALGAAALVLPGLWGATRLATVSNQEESAEGRVDAWYEGFQMLIGEPVLGVGFGNFTDYNDLTAHNSLVLVLAETGIAGYTLWFIFCAYCVRAVYRAAAWRQRQSDEQVTASRAVLLMCIGFMVAAMFLSRSYTALLFIVCGLALARASEAGVDTGRIEGKSAQLRPLLYTALTSIPIMFLLTKLLLAI